MLDSQERIAFKIFGVFQGAAEGRFAITSLLVMALAVLLTVVWLRLRSG